MSKSHHQRAPVKSLTPRPGDGVVVDVVVNQFVAADGTTMANLGLNAAKIDVPDRRYTADTCAVSEHRGTVKLIFAQERIDGSAWRSLLVVHMSRDAVSRFLTTIKQIANPSLDEIASAAHIDAEPLATNFNEPSQAIALSANVVLSAVSGSEACLDFYQASPFSMSAVAASRKLALEPVVRVDLRTSLFLALIENFRSLGITAQEFKTPGEA